MSNLIHNSKFTIQNSQLNPNTLYAQHIVHAFAQAGLTAVCISPGSRSTPLTLAFDAHPDIEVHLMLDERSGGFFALGMALATDTPVALLCTSGTAVANYLPAIIEAKMSHVPLLILTADRPPELRHSGANQTIDQVKIYGDQVLWSVDLPLPQHDTPDVALRNLHTLAHRAHATANGLPKGPVHLNFPFRKPLEPVDSEKWLVDSANSQFIIHNSQLIIEKGTLLPTKPQLNQIASLINQHPNGLIICGPRCPSGNFPQAVAGLSQMSGYPILADSISGVRFGAHVAETAVISSYETFLQSEPAWPDPDIIIRFGALPISKWLNSYMSRVKAKHRIHIRENGVWADDSHTTSYFLQANEELFCYQTAFNLTPRTNSVWVNEWMEKETAVWQSINQAIFDPYFDASIIADVVEMLPENSTLFMGNSLPIRHLDQFGQAQTKQIYAHANRGASGIDGNISTALGIAAATNRPLIAILGDITFYHDMNGLLAANDKGQMTNDLTFVVINNNGGGIFNRLPISQFEPPFTKLFTTPHGLQFEHAAKLYGLDYHRVTERAAFKKAFTQPHNAPKLIEVFTNGRFDHKRRQEIT